MTFELRSERQKGDNGENSNEKVLSVKEVARTKALKWQRAGEI